MLILSFISRCLRVSFLSATLIALVMPVAVAQKDHLVIRYFESLSALQAEFSQTVFDEQNNLMQQSGGQVFMQRPGRFRWDYQQPYAQLIIADGERLWLYDIDLEQITVKRLDESISAAPLAVLSGAAPVEQVFEVGQAYTRDGLQWYELYPKNQQSEFHLLRVGFADGTETLRVLELEDNFQRRTRLDLDKVERNPSLDKGLFEFTPPAGVDVVGDQ